MDELQLQEIAAQLRQPHGYQANEVGERMNKGNQQMNLFAINALKPDPADRVLEIGMGNGYFVGKILSEYPSVHYSGCDFSEAMVETARQINAVHITNNLAAFETASAEELPFANESFQKVFTVNTVYFWDNPTAVLDEIKRVLVIGGQLSVAFRPKSLMELFPFTQFGFTLYSTEDLVVLLSENGFRIIKILEDEEPDIEFNGEFLRSVSILICAEKIG